MFFALGALRALTLSDRRGSGYIILLCGCASFVAECERQRGAWCGVIATRAKRQDAYIMRLSHSRQQYSGQNTARDKYAPEISTNTSALACVCADVQTFYHPAPHTTGAYIMKYKICVYWGIEYSREIEWEKHAFHAPRHDEGSHGTYILYGTLVFMRHRMHFISHIHLVG